MDEADIAQARMEQEEEWRRRYSRQSPSLPRTGYCHWCGEAVRGDRLFCDADCRDDWERERRMRRANGSA